MYVTEYMAQLNANNFFTTVFNIWLTIRKIQIWHLRKINQEKILNKQLEKFLEKILKIFESRIFQSGSNWMQ